jgi:uncharacterized protein (TIGR03067 family)
MRFPSFAVAIVVLSTLIFTPAARADDLKAMEGKWKVESAEAGGKPVESPELKALVVTITGDRYELMTDEGPDGGTLKLDETQNPKAMDATDTEGLTVGKMIKAIYELSGDTLRVCYALDGGERPKEFATKADSPLLLITYRREK